MASVKIKRNGKEAEVEEIYLNDFLRDGWKEVSKKDDDSANAKALKEKQEKDEKDRLEQEALLGRQALDKERENEQALARIEAEKREKAEHDAAEMRVTQRVAEEDAVRDHHHKIQAMEDKEAVVQYVKENFDENLDKRGTLDTVKEKAKAVADESKRVD